MTTFTTTSIADIVTAGTTNRDGIIIELVTGYGLSLNKATNEYAKYAKDNGLTSAIVSHKDDAMAYLADTYGIDGWDADAVRGAVVELQARYDVAESTARDYTKAYSDSMGMVHPTSNPRDLIFAWFKDNAKTATKEEFKAYAKSIGRSESNANEYWKGYELHLHLVG